MILLNVLIGRQLIFSGGAMSIDYLLFFDHYSDEENETGDDYNSMEFQEEDTLAGDLEESLAQVREQMSGYPPGHPIFYRDGIEFVQAEPGSPEAKHKRLNGRIVKI